ncbi:Uptake hydrogenase large subunit [Yersinia enterocolitica]|nr:Uptake hydrogenase large subunit [Yersinia enterocolitica]
MIRGDAWMIVQRICGVCTTIHAIASVRAVENALGMEVPVNAQHIRNLILARTAFMTISCISINSRHWIGWIHLGAASLTTKSGCDAEVGCPVGR